MYQDEHEKYKYVDVWVRLFVFCSYQKYVNKQWVVFSLWQMSFFYMLKCKIQHVIYWKGQTWRCLWNNCSENFL